MKLGVPILAALVLAAAAPVSHAAGATTLGLQGGLSLPIGDFGDVASLGFHVGAAGTTMLNDRLGLGGDVLWHGFGVDDQYEEAQAVQAGSSVDVSFSTLQVTAHAIYLLPSSERMMPYLKGGVGLYNSRAKVEGTNVARDDSDTDVGLLFGGGINYKATRPFGYGLEAAYHYIASGGDATTLLTLAGKLTFDVGAK